MKTFWLSFCDEHKPEGERFLGVAVVDVTEEDAAACLPEIETKFPNRMPDSEWLLAASRKAWDAGCNPGGQIASWEITNMREADLAPRYVLLSKDALKQLNLIGDSQ